MEPIRFSLEQVKALCGDDPSNEFDFSNVGYFLLEGRYFIPYTESGSRLKGEIGVDCFQDHIIISQQEAKTLPNLVRACFKEGHEEATRIVEIAIREPVALPLELSSYARTHDDHDGTFIGVIEVTLLPNGDMYFMTDTCTHGLRFRNLAGGGHSLHVWNALRILALAIDIDNKERPERPQTQGDEL